MTTYLYAAYGSNLHPTRLVRRVPSAKLIDTARVPGFDLHFHKRSVDGSAKCDIVAAAGEIHVAVFEILLKEKPLLDKVEGLGIGYDEMQIAVPGVGDCWAYKAIDSHIEPTLISYTWYKAMVLLGCEFHGFPDRYTQKVREVAHQRDQDEQRHQENSLLVEGMRNGT
ncbi:MAG: gamma-glutamylcyclotransferase [Gammaproteobacteria bacterium]|nr:gamma-glutamylcyclotransferase [Gammaproteobacteria bacterium]MBT8093289.1 gamma-glutamylcyclotransferase [Gammaproteobacteria bacterium]